MSDTRGLLDRIVAFRRRLESTPYLIPDAIAVDPVAERSLESEAEAFRQRLRQLVAASPLSEGPPGPSLTGEARRLLAVAKTLLERQRAFTTDPFFAGLASDPRASDPLVGYHRETVAVLESAIRIAQSFPESPAVQLKQCTGLDGLLGVVAERLTVQERALALRKADAERIDRLAAVYAGMAEGMATGTATGTTAGMATGTAAGAVVGLPAVVSLAEELLEEARTARPLRLVSAPPDSTAAYPGARCFPAPIRYLAAHGVNVAQVVARLVSADPDWAARPLPAMVAALLIDCGMTAVPVTVVAKPGGLTPGERQLIEAHAAMGAERIVRCYPQVAPLAAAVAAHHERLDGTGYPNGTSGPAIPGLARLLAVADVYAALSSPRPHRAARDGRAALTETLLLAEQGLLDRTRAELLVRLSFYPVGTVVELTDGRVAVVAANHPNPADPRSPGRPVVAVLTAADGSLLPHPEPLDLAAADRGGILRALPPDRRRELLGSRYPDLC